MKLSVIIVSYNVKHFLEQCLDSVFAAIDHGKVEAEVFVVDNDSPDNTVGYITNHFTPVSHPNLHIIANARNVGFGRANNQALRRATGEYILFLNPDTILTEHTLGDVIAFADAHDDLGGLGVHMLGADGNFARESRRALPTPWVSFCKMTGLTQLFPKSRRLGKYYMGYLPLDAPCQIEIISGACMLCRKSALDEVGGFDEDFFMYGEDIDLSYRLLKAGYKNYYHPTPILHYKGESTKKNTYNYVHVFYEAMLIFYRKHFLANSVLLTTMIRLAIYSRALMSIISNQIDSLRHFLNMGMQQRPDLYLYDPKAPGSDRLVDIAEHNGINLIESDTPGVSCHELNMQRNKENPIDAVVFNTKETSYGEMLQYIAQNEAHDYALGTFNPNTNILIACHQSYS